MNTRPLITSLSVLALSGSLNATGVMAQEGANHELMEEVITTGTRIQGRSALDSAAPIDVVSGEDFINQGDTDLSNLLRNVVPSYNVNAQPISDAATIVRPANLRGLPPDSTLVLVNGKRRHRAAVISFLGGGLSDGAQGPDISSIPSIALKQVEVLRDGAAAQYGSDAIAGVMNFKLKDAAEGGTLETKWGSTYEGDGDTWQIAGNLGLPFTSAGFVNLSFEYREADATSRSVQRDDAAVLIANGNNDVQNPAQIWGQPEVDDDLKLVANLGVELGGGKEFYAFGIYNSRTADGGFYFRHPDTRPGVYSNDGGVTRLVGDLDLENDVTCPTVPVGDAALLAQIMDNSTAIGADCFVFNEVFPGGFTPRFGGDLNDISGVAGVRGDMDSGMTYDVSIGAGRNEVDFFIYNTVNATLGPNTPTSFDPGTYIQLEKNFNVDLTYPVEIGLASPLNVAGGFEWREEQFEALVGDPESFAAGKLKDQGFSIGSNGFPGFSENVAGSWDRRNVAVYLDLETEVTESLLLGMAVRWEDFSDFGTTSNGKLSARYDISDSFSIRSTVSTGFRAPTPGQSNVSNISTVFDNGNLVNRGTIPPTNPVAVAEGGKPLEPEESESFSFGVVFNIGAVDVTIDYFNIDVSDRITQSASIEIDEARARELEALGISGASSLSQIRFYTNEFDTTTQGVDVVVTYPFEMFGGDTNLNFAFNWTETEVQDKNELLNAVPRVIDQLRIDQIEKNLPEYRGNISLIHNNGPWRGLLRLNYFDEYCEVHLDAGSCSTPADGINNLRIDVGEEWTVDAEVAYSFNEKYTVVLGAENLLDEYPDENPWAGEAGAEYPVTSPMGFNGGFYYMRLRYDF